MADKCASCGRRLRDPESMVRGYGPVCFRRLRVKKLRHKRQAVVFDWRQLDLFRGPVQMELF